MAIRDIFKVTRKTFFNPSAWLDYGFIRDQTRANWSTLKTIFEVDKPTYTETFAEAMQRLGLSEQEVKQTAFAYGWYALFFLLLGTGIFFYSFFLLFAYGYWVACFLGLSAAGLFLAQAFRYDFWCVQIQLQRLGMSLDDWLQYRLGGKGKST